MRDHAAILRRPRLSGRLFSAVAAARFPQEVSRQADVLPAQRRRVAQQRVGRHLACRALMRDGVGDVGGVPVDNGDEDSIINTAALQLLEKICYNGNLCDFATVPEL